MLNFHILSFIILRIGSYHGNYGIIYSQFRRPSGTKSFPDLSAAYYVSFVLISNYRLIVVQKRFAPKIRFLNVNHCPVSQS